jgi:hypothetical protein
VEEVAPAAAPGTTTASLPGTAHALRNALELSVLSSTTAPKSITLKTGRVAALASAASHVVATARTRRRRAHERDDTAGWGAAVGDRDRRR